MWCFSSFPSRTSLRAEARDLGPQEAMGTAIMVTANLGRRRGWSEVYAQGHTDLSLPSLMGCAPIYPHALLSNRKLPWQEGSHLKTSIRQETEPHCPAQTDGPLWPPGPGRHENQSCESCLHPNTSQRDAEALTASLRACLSGLPPVTCSSVCPFLMSSSALIHDLPPSPSPSISTSLASL